MRISDWSSDVCSSDLHVDRLLDRMGDEEEGFALLRDQGQQVLLELAPGLLVDRRERLVHQQHLGVDGEGAGKADALAHAARQLVRVGLLETLEADLADVALRHRPALAAGDAPPTEAEDASEEEQRGENEWGST